MNEAPWHDVGSYDQAFAAYLDARKRFSDLRLARGFLPIVAYFSRFQPNVKGPATYKYSPAPMKAAEPKARAKAALCCLRCGQPGHVAANCPVPSKTGTSEPTLRCLTPAYRPFYVVLVLQEGI